MIIDSPRAKGTQGVVLLVISTADWWRLSRNERMCSRSTELFWGAQVAEGLFAGRNQSIVGTNKCGAVTAVWVV